VNIVSLAYFSGLLSVVSSGQIFTSSSGLTGSWTSIGTPFLSNKIHKHFHDGTRYIATIRQAAGTIYQPAFYYSSDLLSWSHRGISNKTWSDTIETIMGSDGTNLAALPGGTASGGLYGQFSTANAVGIPYPVFQYFSNGAQAQETTYVKVKR
jgi:hypothetical protein